VINAIGRAPSHGHQRAEESFWLIDGVTSLHGQWLRPAGESLGFGWPDHGT
jgi:hypothetical protein